jgi:hypothetical protein
VASLSAFHYQGRIFACALTSVKTNVIFFCKHGQYYRRKHLYKCLLEAKDKENDRKGKENLAIIKQEKSRSFWRRLNHLMGKHRGGAPQRVLVEEGQEDNLVDYNAQEPVQTVIFDNIHKKYSYLLRLHPFAQEMYKRLLVTILQQTRQYNVYPHRDI